MVWRIITSRCVAKCNEFCKYKCDLMIIAGTSLVVSPANTLPIYAKQNKATLIEINPENTAMSGEMDLVIRNTSAEVITKISFIV